MRAGLNAYLWAETVNFFSPPSCACTKSPNIASASTHTDRVAVVPAKAESEDVMMVSLLGELGGLERALAG
jgi:hypothetical protein